MQFTIAHLVFGYDTAGVPAGLIDLTPRLKQPVCLMLQAQGLTA